MAGGTRSGVEIEAQRLITYLKNGNAPESKIGLWLDRDKGRIVISDISPDGDMLFTLPEREGDLLADGLESGELVAVCLYCPVHFIGGPDWSQGRVFGVPDPVFADDKQHAVLAIGEPGSKISFVLFDISERTIVLTLPEAEETVFLYTKVPGENAAHGSDFCEIVYDQIGQVSIAERDYVIRDAGQGTYQIQLKGDSRFGILNGSPELFDRITSGELRIGRVLGKEFNYVCHAATRDEMLLEGDFNCAKPLHRVSFVCGLPGSSVVYSDQLAIVDGAKPGDGRRLRVTIPETGPFEVEHLEEALGVY